MPLEFKFEVNELVMILPMDTLGKIIELQQYGLGVELLNREDNVYVSWANVWKHIVPGEYAEILSRSHQGHQGFIMAMEGFSVTMMVFTKTPGLIMLRTIKVGFPFHHPACTLY
jgi:hypothetical protein